ncbi:MAG: PadR family transcriptional regulator, partial [Alphaproteobacteria bacterium]
MAEHRVPILGTFELQVMQAVRNLRENAYGMSIRRHLVEVCDNDVSLGALYTTLERLERKGLVKSRMGEATPERGGRRKKYFILQVQGQLAI